MVSIRAAIGMATVLVVASGSSLVLAQAPPRATTPELEALNPPVPADLVLSEDRRVPAENKAAAYADRVLVISDGRIREEIALGRRDVHDTGPLVSRLAELGL